MTETPPLDQRLAAVLAGQGVELRRYRSGRLHTIRFPRGARPDQLLLEEIARLERLTELYLPAAELNDSQLTVLLGESGSTPRLGHLQTLDLQHTALSDAAIDCLGAMSQLKLLVLTGTAISREGLKQLRQRLLETRIVCL